MSNWQPEHFPVGTIVLLKNFERTDEGVSYKGGRGIHFAKVVVSSLIRNGLDSWLIRTNEFKEYTGRCSYNFDHVDSIVKRGTGKVNIETYCSPMINLKSYISFEPLAKRRYYWQDSREILLFLIKRYKVTNLSAIKEGFFEFVMQQSFIRKERNNGFYSVAYSADKKKLQRFIHQNINRWITPMKEIRASAEAEAKAEQEQYYRDMRDDFDREFEEDLV